MSIIVPVRAAGISQTAVVVDTCPHCCCRYLPTLLLPALAHTDVAGICHNVVVGTCPQCCRCRYLRTVLSLPVLAHTAVVAGTCLHCCCRYLPTLLLLPALAHTAVACTFPTLLLPAFALTDVAGTCPHCCCRHLPTLLLLPVLTHTAVVAGTYPHCCCCRHLPTLMLPEFQLLSSLGPSVSKHFVLNRGTHGIRSGFVGSLQNREVCEI